MTITDIARFILFGWSSDEGTDILCWGLILIWANS